MISTENYKLLPQEDADDEIRANHVDKGWVRHYTACDLITALRFLGLCPILVGKIRVSP